MSDKELYYETGVQITPEVARRMLTTNVENNRNKKTSRIPNMVRDMQLGNWLYPTGETLKFNVDGQLMDGQNRLTAVVESGATVTFDVAYNVPLSSMHVIDTQSVRTFGDSLMIAGSERGVRFNTASILRWHMMWKNGRPMGLGLAGAPTRPEMMATYLADPAKYDDAGRRGRDFQVRGLGGSRAVGMAKLLFDEIDHPLCTRFLDDVIVGAGLKEGDPALTLRNKMSGYKSNRLNIQEQLASYIRAWNALRNDTPLFRIQPTRGEVLSDKYFPQPK